MFVRNGKPPRVQDLLVVDTETFFGLVDSPIIEGKSITAMGLYNIFWGLCSHDISENGIIQGWQLLSWALANQQADEDTYPYFRDA